MNKTKNCDEPGQKKKRKQLENNSSLLLYVARAPSRFDPLAIAFEQ